MSISRIVICLSIVACSLLARAQAPEPTSFAITEAVAGGAPGANTTIYRSGTKVLMDFRSPAQGGTPASRTLTLYDLQTHVSVTWDPAANPPACGSVGTFSGDWGDPFTMISDVNSSIAKGEIKAAGTETIAGIPTQIYAGTSSGSAIKVWVDSKDGLVMRAVVGMPGGASLTMADITKVSIGPQPASLFVLPAVCKGVKPPPSAADLIADETGDDPANYASNAGPGSKNGCSVVLRVVSAKTMTPISHIQVVIDTAVFPDNAPPAYTMGVGDDGTTTYSGGHVMEITNRVHNGMVRLGLPPDHFMLGVNVPLPHHGGSIGLVYRQCFAPTTVLLDVVKDYGQQDQSQDLLWVKADKYAAVPAQ
jgi:hypothetical protein